MKESEKKMLNYGICIIVGLVLGYFLFSSVSTPSVSTSGTGCTEGTTVSTPTDDGTRICTTVCVPRPKDCPRECPPGTHYQCSGTIAMNCGCFPDPTTPATPNNDCPPPLVWDSGRQTCISCPVGMYYDTAKATCMGYV